MAELMTPEQTRKMTGFATALGALKAKEELGQGCTLTPDEVAGLIWGIKNLRGGVQRDSADHPT